MARYVGAGSGLHLQRSAVMNSRLVAFLMFAVVGVSSVAALTAGDKAAKPKMITESYTVADLPIWRGPIQGEHAFDASAVIALIMKTVPPGDVETIIQFDTNLSLVVSGTQDGHERVAKVLRSLRPAKP